MSLPLKARLFSAALAAAVPLLANGQLPADDFSAGVAALTQKNNAEAVRLFTKVVLRNPQNTVALWGRGAAYGGLGEFDQAIADYDAAIRIDPKFGFAFASRAGAWLAKGEYAKALDDCDKAIHLDPKSAAAHNDRAWMRATCRDEKYRDGTKAIEDATKACELTDWKRPEYLDTLAAAYAEAGQFDKAVEWQEKAVESVAEDQNVDDFATRLELYQAEKPYRQERM